MADDLTTTADVAWDQAAYDRMAYFALRPELYYDRIADVQPTRQTMPGSSVIFTQIADLAVASTALNESVDVDAVGMTDAQVTVTLKEYGNAVKTTAKLRGTSFLEVDPMVANVVGFNAGRSMDTVVQGVLEVGTNVVYAGQAISRATVIPTDVITADKVRRVLAQLKGANVATIGGLYNAWIHPDVEYDLRRETGAAAWRDPHTYSQPAEIWNGEIGSFEGFRFMTTPRAPVFTDAGSSTTLTDTYRTLFAGRQALAKAYSTQDGNAAQPRVVATPVVDNLRRFSGFGWYWLGGYGIFRQAALRSIESASSIGTNA